MQKRDIARYAHALEKERALVEAELTRLGARDPSNPADWVPAKPEGDEFGADRNDNADIIEDMEDDNASLNELEGRLRMVEAALERIEEGAYGVCEEGGEPIEEARLAANPAATTCTKHMKESGA